MSSSCKQNALVVLVAPKTVVLVGADADAAWSHYLLLTFSCTCHRRQRRRCFTF